MGSLIFNALSHYSSVGFIGKYESTANFVMLFTRLRVKMLSVQYKLVWFLQVY